MSADKHSSGLASSEARYYRASLILNAILVVAILALALYASGPAGAASAARAADSKKATGGMHSAGRQSVTAGYADMKSPSEQRRWLVDQLRAMGVPNKVMGRVVLSDLDAAWTRHAADVTLRCHGDPATMAALQLDVDLSRDAEMRAALGEEGFRQWDEGNMLREVDQGKIALSGAETETIYDLWKDLQQRELELKQAGVKAEMDDAEIDDAHDKAFAEFNRQVKALLGEERYAKSQQTDEAAASAGLKQAVARANPTDAQFQQLLKAQQQWNDQRVALDKQFQNDTSSSTYAEKLRTLNAARDEEYQRVLGAGAFDTFQKEQNRGYLQMKMHESLWGLDDSSIDSVYGAIRYYEKTAEDYRSQARSLEAQGENVDWDGVNENLKQFADQTRQSLKSYLGQDRFDKLQQNGVFQPFSETSHN